jgi:hypothetical protein
VAGGHAGELGEAGGGVVEVLEDLAADDEVEARVGVRERVDRGLAQDDLRVEVGGRVERDVAGFEACPGGWP